MQTVSCAASTCICAAADVAQDMGESLSGGSGAHVPPRRLIRIFHGVVCLFESLIEATCSIDRESHATDYMKLLLLIALYCGAACTSYCAEGHRTTFHSRKALLPKAVHM